ncbi:MAG: polyprenyl synthetase family protein [Pseudomonadota bacterium]
MDFKAALGDAQTRVEAFIQSEFDRRNFGPLAEPMSYAVLNGGKRLRAFLVLETALLHGVPEDRALFAAAAIECIHAYSLVHDDLPCMDDDDLRRGKPTVHIKWDEATAVLVGDGLQSVAFEFVSDDQIGAAEVRADLTRSLAIASGSSGMVLGQALDIEAETSGIPTVDQIIRIQSAKTGALIAWAAEAGPRLALADPTPLGIYARHIGLAFQIQDDVIDVEGSEIEAGKRLQKDEDAGKATFVSLLGLDAAKKRASDEVEAAISALDSYPDTGHLAELAQFIIHRST